MAEAAGHCALVVASLIGSSVATVEGGGVGRIGRKRKLVVEGSGEIGRMEAAAMVSFLEGG